MLTQNIDSEDDLTDAEFALLKESYMEALQIKKGLKCFRNVNGQIHFWIK